MAASSVAALHAAAGHAARAALAASVGSGRSAATATSGAGGRVMRAAVEVFFRATPSNLWTAPSVIASSLVIVGSFFWVPAVFVVVWRRCDTRRKKLLALAVAFALLFIPMPHSEGAKKSCLWDRWSEYLQITVRGAHPYPHDRQAMFAMVPHGIFPFGLALAALGKLNKVFNDMLVVVASATKITPVFGHLIKSIGAVDATPSDVRKALQSGRSLGVAPGGIGEMFLGYPRPGCKPDEEYVLLRQRKGFVRMAIERGIPIVPVYVFGVSKLLKRLELPWFVELISRWLQASIVVFWGRMGLPVPFRIPLTYVLGETVETTQMDRPTREAIDSVHAAFCESLQRAFERHKHEYGWGHKRLVLV